ncbi:hypothetical protein EPO34_01660 [Patescibacteria group bacterium]|nr:MAG: hypothetical protein EPO34_01660 [Patescibacteria group bacterium]
MTRKTDRFSLYLALFATDGIATGLALSYLPAGAALTLAIFAVQVVLLVLLVRDVKQSDPGTYPSMVRVAIAEEPERTDPGIQAPVSDLPTDPDAMPVPTREPAGPERVDALTAFLMAMDKPKPSAEELDAFPLDREFPTDRNALNA